MLTGYDYVSVVLHEYDHDVVYTETCPYTKSYSKHIRLLRLPKNLSVLDEGILDVLVLVVDV